MDARTEAAAAFNPNTFEPASDVIHEDECTTLILYLPGFTKEQLKVQLTRQRVLRISGRRPLTNDRWSSFLKEFPVPENCDTNKISAKFEDGILYVKQPKDANRIAAAETPKPAEVLPPPPPAAKIDPPPHQPTPIKKTDQTSGDTKPKIPPAKPVESKDKDEIKSADKSGVTKEEKKQAAGKSGGGDEKAAEKRGGGDEKAVAAGNKAAEKRDKGRGDGAGKVEADYSNLSAASPAARLKDARKKMTNIVVLLCVFALGIYVSRLPWFSKRAGD